MGEARGEGERVAPPKHRYEHIDIVNLKRKLYPELRKLKGSMRPARPLVLADLLINCHFCDGPPYFTKPDRIEMEDAVDKALDKFIEAARSLYNAIPRSDHYYVIADLMKDRIQDKPDILSDLYYFDFLEDYLSYIQHSPVLGERKRETADQDIAIAELIEKHKDALIAEDFPAASLLSEEIEKAKRTRRAVLARKGRVNKPHERRVVRAVCWYIHRVERNKPTLDFDDETGFAKSKAAVLSQIALESLDLSSQGLKTHLRAVLKETTWKDDGYLFESNFLGNSWADTGYLYR